MAGLTLSDGDGVQGQGSTSSVVDVPEGTEYAGGLSIDLEEDGSATQDFQARFDKISEELKQVWNGDELKDKIEWVDKDMLNWPFAEYLLTHESQLTTLRTFVGTIKRDGLSRKAWEAIDLLADFIDDIWNPERMEKDYQEFMRKIENPKKLNTMHTWEIRRLNLYLWMHEDKALEAYNKMKPTRGHYEEKWMKSQDKEFFEGIWKTMESNYSNSDKFMENDYPAVKWLQPTVASLKNFAGQNWDWSDNINVPDAENSFVKKEKVIAKFKEVNQQRISANEEKVKNISIADELNRERANFKKEDWVLKYNGEAFTMDTMVNTSIFRQAIDSKADDNTQFVWDEKNNMVLQFKEQIYTNSVSVLADLEDTTTQQQNENPDNTGNPETQTESLSSLEVGKDVVKIKDSKLKEAITKDPTKFCDSLEGDTIKFDMTAVKTYLEWLKDKPWKDFKSMKGVEKETWSIAVQIALTHLNKQESWKYNGKCDVTWIDGIRKWKTIAWVKWFQTEWNAQHSWEKPLRVDGAPGQHTINAILWELWWTQSSSTDSTDTEWDDDTSTETTSNTPKSITDRIGEMSDNILDLSDMTSLDKAGATEIANWLNGKTDVTVNLSWLTSLDGETAGELSNINWKINIDGILQGADFEDSDFINTLTVLAPKSGNLVIETDSDNYDNLKDKTVKVEARAS